MNRKYPVLFGTLLSLSAHTVIAMTLYTLNSTNINGKKQIIDFPLVDLTWQEPQTKPVIVHTENQNDTKSRPAKRKPSTTKSMSRKSDIPHDLKPSIYNEMPIYPEHAKDHNIDDNIKPSFIDVNQWKKTRIYN